MLGFGPCHHMIEVFQHPESMQLWIAADEGRPDWDPIFKDYNSAVDYPSAAYWRELTSTTRTPRCCTRCAIRTSGSSPRMRPSCRPTACHAREGDDVSARSSPASGAACRCSSTTAL